MPPAEESPKSPRRNSESSDDGTGHETAGEESSIRTPAIVAAGSQDNLVASVSSVLGGGQAVALSEEIPWIAEAASTSSSHRAAELDRKSSRLLDSTRQVDSTLNGCVGGQQTTGEPAGGIGTEQTPPPVIHLSVKRGRSNTGRVLFLRAVYTYSSAVFAGYVLILAMDVLLHFVIRVFLQRTTADGIPPGEQVAMYFAALAVPVLTSFWGGLFTLATGMVEDVWNDFEFAAGESGLPRSWVEWTVMTLIFLVPVFSFAVASLMRVEIPLRILLLASFWCTAVVYALYLCLVVSNEYLVCKRMSPRKDLPGLLWHQIKQKMSVRLSLWRKVKAPSSLDDTCLVTQEDLITQPKCTMIPVYLRWCYVPVCTRLWSQRDVNPRAYMQRMTVFHYLMLSSSTMEGVFTFGTPILGTIFAFVVAALLLCLVTGVLLRVASSWAQAIAILSLSFVAVLLGWCYFQIKKILKYHHLKKAERKQMLEKTLTIAYAKPTNGVVITLWATGAAVLIAVPACALMGIGLYLQGIFFLGTACLWSIRWILDPHVLMRVHGPRMMQADSSGIRMQRATYLLLVRMTTTSVTIITKVFLLFGAFVFFYLALGTISESSYETATFFPPTVRLTPAKGRGLLYNLCNFDPLLLVFRKKRVDYARRMTVADFAYINEITYTNRTMFQTLLEGWFGTGVNDVTDELKEKYKAPDSMAEYRIVNVTSSWAANKLEKDLPPYFYILVVRGTENRVDTLQDMNLWMAAFAIQVMRFLIPVNSVWNPVYPDLIWYMSLLENFTSEFDYFKPVDDFIDNLRADLGNNFPMVLTGHSLGGGVAMVVGTKQGLPALGFSAPNAVLSHRKFGVSLAGLDQYSINFVPQKDLVPKVDDKAMLFENFKCDKIFIKCHSILQSLCTIMYTCGSAGRPTLQECVTKKGFPMPPGATPSMLQGS